MSRDRPTAAEGEECVPRSQAANGKGDLTRHLAILLALRVPIAFALGLSSLGYMYWFMPASISLTVIP